jgi:hypothetical protein
MILRLMKRFASATRKSCARWIFIFGVLAGLFFSGGEGIQLLPFPVIEANNSKNTSFILESNSKSYAFTVFSSGNYSTLFKSKFQKHANQHLSGANPTFSRLDAGANFCRQAAQIRQEANLLHLAAVADSQSNRAPPAI